MSRLVLSVAGLVVTMCGLVSGVVFKCAALEVSLLVLLSGWYSSSILVVLDGLMTMALVIMLSVAALQDPEFLFSLFSHLLFSGFVQLIIARQAGV